MGIFFTRCFLVACFIVPDFQYVKKLASKFSVLAPNFKEEYQTILKSHHQIEVHMYATLALPELMYLSPTTRERAIIITQELLRAGNISPKEAVSKAILIAKNWAVKNVNRKVWKKLKLNDKEVL